MKILTVHPGSAFSTHDLYSGLVPQLREQGAEVVECRLDARISHSRAFLMSTWHREAKRYPEPTLSDVLYHAGMGLIERALRHQPDWVLVFSAMYLHPDILVMLRRAGVKVAVLLSESPYDDEKQGPVAATANIAWTNERSSVAYLQKFNPAVRYLRHAFNPAVHNPDLPDEAGIPSHDVVFVGTGFKERIELLSQVDFSGMDFTIYGPWPLLGSRHRLRRHLSPNQGHGVFGGVDNPVAAALYRQAKIGLSLHRTSKGFGREVPHISYAESMGPRDYELAATGSFFISDYRAELAETLPAVPIFHSAPELEDLLRRFLADGAARQRLVRELVEQASGHTFAARAAQILEDLRLVGGGDLGPVSP